MYYHSLLLVIIISVNLTLSLSEQNDSWTVGSPFSARSSSNWGRLVGYDVNKNEIVLIGGWLSTKTKIIAYNIDNNTFIKYDNNSKSVYAFANAYTQINNLLYMFTTGYLDFPDGVYLSVLELDTKEFTKNYHNTSLPSFVDAHTSLCNFNNNYLIIIGGFNNGALNTVLIYSINDNIWLPNIPTLQTERYDTSCSVSNNKLYVFGGRNTRLYLKTIEKLNIYDLIFHEYNLIFHGYNNTNIAWIKNQHSLSLERSESRSVIYNNNIYIIGGKTTNTRRVATVDVLNTITDEVSLFIPLQYNLSATSAITVDNKIYVFAGSVDATHGSNKWQYFAFPITTTQYITTTESITRQCMNNSQCNVGFVCQSYECLRDCNTFAIDEYLTQCSTKFNGFESEQNKNIKTIITKLKDNTYNLQEQIDNIVNRLDSFQPVVDSASKAYFGIPINGGESEISSPFKDELIIFMVLMNILFVVCICFLYYKLTRVSRVVNYEKVDVDLN